MKKIPQELPIFMIAGTEDPIGNYGESLKLLKNIYNQNGIKTVDLKLYDDCRHELFNEKNSDEVINDVVTWIQTNVK
jgi:alpha-beta hydrolase superfamily lysophospholipase